VDRDLGRFSRDVALIDHADGLQRAALRRAARGHSPLSLSGEYLEAFRTVASAASRRAAGRRRVLPLQPDPRAGHVAAAKQARLLEDVLHRAADEPEPIAALQSGFMSEVASVLETPWIMSTSADLAFPQTRGERPDNFAEAREFEAALFRAAVADPVVHRAMIEVAHLLEPHSLLQEPDIIRRIEAVPVRAAA